MRSRITCESRLVFRAVAGAPWFSGLAIATLAVGIGSAVTLFSLIYAVLLRPLPFEDPEGLVEVTMNSRERTGMRVPSEVLEKLRTDSNSVAQTATHAPVGADFRSVTGMVDIHGDRVSANYLDVLGVSPALGRGFVPGEDRVGSQPVVVVTHDFWLRQLGGKADAIGRTLSLNNIPFELVGVMPVGFRTAFRGLSKDYWTPFRTPTEYERELESGYELVARLNEGATTLDAAQEINAIASATLKLRPWS